MERKRSARRGRDAAAGPSRWQQNHGNLLLMFTAILLVVGSLIIAWRQSRPPRTRFPVNAGRLENGATVYPTIMLSTEDSRRSVAVRIFGAANDTGIMRIAVYDRPADLSDPEQAAGLDSWPITDGISEGRLEVPPDMRFIAMAVFHDENGNGILDRNALGIPTERYGFSGDVRGLVGPPDFADAAVRLSDEPIDISIR